MKLAHFMLGIIIGAGGSSFGKTSEKSIEKAPPKAATKTSEKPAEKIASKIVIKADVYEAGAKRGPKLFTGERSFQDKGGGVSEVKVVFYDLSGKKLLEESCDLKNLVVVKCELVQTIPARTSSLVVDKDVVTFLVPSLDGRIKPLFDKIKGDFMTVSSFMIWTRENWDKIKLGNSLTVQSPGWLLGKALSISVVKTAEETVAGQKVFTLQVKPVDENLAKVVPSSVIKVSDKGEKILSFVGPVALEEKPKRLFEVVFVNGK